MVPRWCAAAADAAENVTVLAVTVLTSLDDEALSDIGMSGPAEKAVLRLAELALENGAGGLVCSPLEVACPAQPLRQRSDGGGPLLVVPGIRPRRLRRQAIRRRTLTPREAVDAGADMIVVGRPITGGRRSRAAAARAIAEELR